MTDSTALWTEKFDRWWAKNQMHHAGDAFAIREKCRAAFLAGAAAEPEHPMILFDVDGTISCGTPRCVPRPGMLLLCDTLACLGYELVAWSAGGAAHAQDHVERCGLHGSVHRYLTKPSYPITEEAALAVVGRRPALQIDDDPTERVGDWPFMQVETFQPREAEWGAAAERAEHEQQGARRC